MFSLQPCGELDFGTLTTSQEYQIPHDPVVDQSLLKGNLICFSATNEEKQLSRTPSFRSRPAADRSRHEGNIVRRGMHREIERKRRQEMSSLYASLHSLLPEQHSKDKSSVCDQMEEAVSYIKQMHKKIEESRSHRDNLKKRLSNSLSSRENKESFEGGGDSSVVIHKVVDGLEILISSKSRELELSRLLSELLEAQLDVVSCVSTKTNGGFLHKLEAMDLNDFEVSLLHDKLINAIK